MRNSTFNRLVALSLIGLWACDDAATAPEDAAPIASDARPIDAALDASDSDAARPDADLMDRGLVDAAPDRGVDAAIAADQGVGDLAIEDAGLDAAPASCVRYTAPVDTGLLPGFELIEVSGIAASRQTPGVFWMHNDSGHQPMLHAFTAEGQPRARIPLDPGLRDLEDVAVARCPRSERWCVFVADCGDNLLQRDEIRILAIPEPPLPGEADRGEVVVDGITTLRRRYPDGPHDVEALVVAPEGDRLWLFTKVEAGPVQIFSSDTLDPSTDLAEVGQFAAPGVAVPMGRMVTGADLHPDGTRLALRVYTGSYEYWLEADGIRGLGRLPARQVALGPLSEPQGEAIGYGADGRSLWTVSESGAGNQPIHRYDCVD